MAELPAGWSRTVLDELLEPGSLTYGIVQPGEHQAEGVPIVRVKDLDAGLVSTESPLRVAAEIESSYRRSCVRSGDVLLSLVGSVGACAVAAPELAGWNLARAVALIRPRTDLDPRWVAYALRGPEAQAYIQSVVNTTVQTTLNLRDLKALPVSLPSLPERQAIVGMLGALDDKIASNRRLADLADHLVRAEVSAGCLRGTTETVEDLVTNVRSTVQPNGVADGTRYIGLEHMPRGRVILDAWGPTDGLGSVKAAFTAGDILFGKLRPYFKKVGLAPRTGGICSTDILVLRPREPGFTAIALATLASGELIDFVSSAASGTRMPRASWDHMKTFPVRLPPPDDVAYLADLLDPLLDAAQRGVEESDALAELRDTLLPELLSGRLRVPGAAELVEAPT